MATLDTTRPFTTLGTAPRATSLLSRLVGAVSAWNDARMTRAALSRLSARELDDIGLCRGDIEDIATGRRL